MAFAVAEGWRSRVGFVATTDGGKSWSFYEPPHIVTYNFLRQGDRYWAIGNETVDYDKPGGGYGVPAVIHSSDGAIWEHTKANVHPCHWQGCHVCNTSGCLASKSLFIDPYGTQATFHEIPAGHLSAAWAAHENEICTIDGTLYCANTLPAADPEKGGGSTAPSERYWPVLGPAPSRGLLRCISCSLEPFLVDPNVSGRFTVHISFVVRQDGTPESVVVEKAPSDGIKAKLREQMLAWIYESPMKDNHPVKVSSQGDIMINVIRSR
jgi:hypothetical protein